MLDLGLIATGVVIWAVLAASARWAPTSSFRRDEIIDRLYVPAFTGLLAGRIVAVVLDDPTSLRPIRGSEKDTSEPQSLIAIPYSVLCLKKKKYSKPILTTHK